MTTSVGGAPAGRRIGPFAAFALVAAAAAIGAVWEISYWVGIPAFSSGILGTTIGIVAALVAFFAWGLSAAPND